MLRSSQALPGLALLMSGALGLTACGDSGTDTPDNGMTTGQDAGTNMPVDTGVKVDMGTQTPDMGVTGRDASTPRDAGHYCAPNNQIRVDNTDVTVPEATMQVPSTTSLRCHGRSRPSMGGFTSNLCFTECLDFMGAMPTQAQVAELEIHAFLEKDMGGNRVDPTYDMVTGRNRSTPMGVGFGIVPTDAATCPSGYQLELGFINQGTETLITEIPHILRIRSRPGTANPFWTTTYFHNFIRRNDERGEASANCANDETRQPQRFFTFPVVPRSLVNAAVTAAGSPVVGADNLSDGRGAGYAIIEARDCPAGGTVMTNAVLGTAPAAVGNMMIKPDFTVDAAATQTLENGLYMAVGLGQTALTSSATVDIHAAMGINRDGTCTEGFGGNMLPIYPDSVTFTRFNREVVIN